MESQADFSQRIRYRVDNFLARGSGALFVALFLAFMGSLVAVVLLRLLFHLVAPEAGDFFNHVWVVFLELTDPGNMNQDNETPPIFKVTAVMAGMAGVVIFSALIAFLTTALEQAIDALKRGDSIVLEKDHTLIMGWGPRVVEILRELVEANESEDDPVVVILSEEPKEEMDLFLRDHFTDRRNTRIVTRSGSTSSLLMLEKVSAQHAKSAIVLATAAESAPAADKSASDAKVIKTVLALVAHVPGDRELSIVAEVYDERNRDVVKDIDPERISVIDAQEILAKIMVQTSRTSGLAVVYSELLSFEGCEMYFYNDPAWAGLSFGQIQFHFPDGVPIGVRQSTGALEIRPEPSYQMSGDDEVLIVAEDDSTIEFRKAPVVTPVELALKEARIAPRAERQLILGWSSKAPIILSEYADYVLMGSLIDVMVLDPPPSVLREIADLNAELQTIQVTHVNQDPLSVEALEEIKPFGYNNVIILPQIQAGTIDPERIDSETLIVLLHLRKLQSKLRAQGHQRFATKIITEVLESQNQELITRAGVDDFIISNRMVSMFLAQISEEAGIQEVYEDLFQEEGSEIYLKPAWLYFEDLPMTCRFGDLMRHVQKRDGEVCIGYKLKAFEHQGARNFGVKLIPPKDTEISLGPEDALVVVAEDDR